MKTGARLHAEEFYRRLWSLPDWSGPAPNLDEQTRFDGMIRLLTRIEWKHVRADSHSPPRILDVGCGRGWLTALLSLEGSVLGIDPLDASVERANQLFPDLDFQRCTPGDLVKDVETGDLEPFDLVVCSEVIEHVPREEQLPFLTDLRTLTPHGTLLMTTPRGELREAWNRLPGAAEQPVEAWLSEKDLDRLAWRAGFEILARDRAYLPRHPLTWHGFLLKYVLGRKWIRSIPLFGLRPRLEYSARFYQIALLQPSDSRF